MFRTITILAVALLCVGLLPVGSQHSATFAATTENFSGGYPGAAGNGWLGPWETRTGGDIGITSGTPGVFNADPLHADSADYAQLGIYKHGTTGLGQVQLGRSYGDSGELQLDQQFVIEFSYRVDEDIDAAGSTFDHYDDRYQIFDRTGPNYTTDANCTWIIFANGNESSSGAGDGRQWIFFDGPNSSFNASSFAPTGVTLTAGTTYDFRLVIRPQESEYDATVSDGTNSYTQANLGFRNGATTVGGWLATGARVYRGSSEGDNDRLFSFDSINMRAPIVADFNGSAGASDIDGWQGKAGNGWAGAWGIKLPAGANTGNTGLHDMVNSPERITGENFAGPMDGPAGGSNNNQFLYFESTGAGNSAIYRQYEDFANVNVTQEHTIRFKWRFDGDLVDFTTGSDRIHLFGDRTSGPSGSSTSNSWLIGVVAGNDYDFVEGVSTDRWYFYDGNLGNNFSANNVYVTDLFLQDDTVYDIAITLHPESQTYDAWISDGTSEASAVGLGYRDMANYVSNLSTYFFAGAAKSSSSDDLGWSIDALEISGVPEPSTLAMLLGLGAVGLLGFLRRRRK